MCYALYGTLIKQKGWNSQTDQMGEDDRMKWCKYQNHSEKISVQLLESYNLAQIFTFLDPFSTSKQKNGIVFIESHANTHQFTLFQHFMDRFDVL
jgi:hypothetical protein